MKNPLLSDQQTASGLLIRPADDVSAISLHSCQSRNTGVMCLNNIPGAVGNQQVHPAYAGLEALGDGGLGGHAHPAKIIPAPESPKGT